MNERLRQTAFPLWEAVCAKTAQAPYVILYEDDAVLVCTKKAGIPVQSKDLRTSDLESMLRVYLTKRQNDDNVNRAHVSAGVGNVHRAQTAADRGCAQAASGRGCVSGAPYLGIVHRLDQPVCGVLVFAKTPKDAAALSKQVQDGTMRKEYLAVCDTSLQRTVGSLGQRDDEMAGQKNSDSSGTAEQSLDRVSAGGQAQMTTVTDYLIKDGRTNLSRVVPKGTKGAKRAVLDMEVLETQDAQSLVHVCLHTGRHHQIRVQLAHLGSPITGDKKYGTQKQQTGFAQLMLCAYRLAFTHPLTGKRMEFDLSEEQDNGKSKF